MGKASKRKGIDRAIRNAPFQECPNVTHEPPDTGESPWFGKNLSVTLTPLDVDECIAVNIHGITHYIHSVTATVLMNRLHKTLTEWNESAKRFGGGVDFDDPKLQ
jgi:hypothetical protein